MPSVNDTVDFPRDRLYPLLVSLVYRRSGIGMVATVVNASILVFVLWGEIEPPVLFSWFGALMLLTGLRFAALILFRRRRRPVAEMRRWGRLLTIGLAAAGVIWGMTGVFLFPLQSTVHQAFIAFVLAGMVAGAVGVFSPLLPVFLAFSLPALLPIFVRFLLLGDTLHLAMAAMTFLFGVLTFLSARHFNESVIELIALKETFAARLEKRTAELENVNRILHNVIQERRKAERAMQRSEEHLSLAADTASLGMWGWHIDRGEFFPNEKSIEITGLTPDEIDNFSIDLWLSKVHPDDRKKLREGMAAQRSGKIERLESEHRFKHPARGWTWLYTNSQVIERDSSGAPRRMVGVHYDITPRKELELERENLIRDLEKALSEVKRLSGLLPICSVCKKIRDDQGYWNQIESYIRERSEAIFSHGLCPDCVRKIYPNLNLPDD